MMWKFHESRVYVVAVLGLLGCFWAWAVRGKAAQWSISELGESKLEVVERPGASMGVASSGDPQLAANVTQHPDGHVHVAIRRRKGDDSVPLSWEEAHARLKDPNSPDLRNLLTKLLQDLPFEAFFWECPPVTRSTSGARRFEFVALEAESLARISADGEPFSEYLSPLRGKPVSKVFPNLGGDSLLVAPAQEKGKRQAIYAHAGAFFRGASPEQTDAQWRSLGAALDEWFDSKGSASTVWVSTEGSGVSWLHMRLDPQPKYYHFMPYMDAQYGLLPESLAAESPGTCAAGDC